MSYRDDLMRPVCTRCFTWNSLITAADKTVRLCRPANPSDGKEASDAKWSTATVLEGVHETGINDVCWSPDGQFLCSVADDKLVAIWDVEKVISRSCRAHHA